MRGECKEAECDLYYKSQPSRNRLQTTWQNPSDLSVLQCSTGEHYRGKYKVVVRAFEQFYQRGMETSHTKK